MNAVSTDKLENELSEISDISDYINNNSGNFCSLSRKTQKIDTQNAKIPFETP